jgi:hypothetical protein
VALVVALRGDVLPVRERLVREVDPDPLLKAI